MWVDKSKNKKDKTCFFKISKKNQVKYQTSFVEACNINQKINLKCVWDQT